MEKQSNFPDFEIQATILFEQWMKDKKSGMRSEDLLLELTHHREIQNGLVEHVSYLADDIPKEFSEELDSLPLFDPKETNKYFTNRRRIQLSASAGVHSPIMEKTLQDTEGFRLLMALIHAVIFFLNEESTNHENILADVEFFVENWEYIQKHHHDCSKIVLHSMCYTMETLLCAMIEKLLINKPPDLHIARGCSQIHKFIFSFFRVFYYYSVFNAEWQALILGIPFVAAQQERTPKGPFFMP